MIDKRRILVADDDESCRELLALALSTPKQEVVTATNGGELLDAVAEHGPFDLIITDINMPWMYGTQVLASLREAELATPMLVITGLDRPELSDAIARLGRTSLLSKPFSVAELRSAVTSLLSGDAITV